MLKFRDRPEFDYDDDAGKDNKDTQQSSERVRPSTQYLELDASVAKAFSRNRQPATLVDVSLNEATDIANNIFGSYGAAIRECVKALTDKRFEVDIKLIANGNTDEASFILTARNYDKGGIYGIPNFNHLYESDGLLGREETGNLPHGKKRTMTATGSSYDFDFSVSHSQVETFQDPVRIIFSPGTEGFKPFKFEVQYSPSAFAIGIQRLATCLKGNASYCHLFHEILTERLRRDINRASPDFIGEVADPEIRRKGSKVMENRVFVTADIGPKDQKFGYALYPNSGEMPFPIVRALRRKEQENT